MTTVFKPPMVEGVVLRLRPVRPDDDAYIYALRVNPGYNRHLSEITGSVTDQNSWIKRYQLREAEGQEIYYIIERLDNRVPCGTVRLYDIEPDHFNWGSWILDENKPHKAALESAVLSFGVGFNMLGKSKALVDVRVENYRAIAFYRRFGMNQIQSQDDQEYFHFNYTCDRFNVDHEGHLRNLRTEALQ
ncbi:GNAT family N-acetyltransferase [Yoonia sp.]|nr:GNAT family N-acetyltransferase [Yoonia sp.]MDB4240808.1 GNAT family N-acetyltransferase [Yoonia sp.]